MRTIELPRPPPLLDSIVAGALSEDYARRVLSVCIKKAESVRDIERATGLPPATVYRYVRDLAEKHLLVVERSALTPDGKRYDVYRSRIRAARIEMDAAGVRVAWEPVEAVEERLARVWNSLRGT